MVLPVFVVRWCCSSRCWSAIRGRCWLGTVCYLVCLPLGWLSYRDHERQDAIVAGTAHLAAADRGVCQTPARCIRRPRTSRRGSIETTPKRSSKRRPPADGSRRGDPAVVDTVILTFAQRSAKGVRYRGQGHCVDIDLHRPVRLRTDDPLLLDDGGLVEVVGAAEPLIEVRAADLDDSRGSPGISATATCRCRCWPTASVPVAIRRSGAAHVARRQGVAHRRAVRAGRRGLRGVAASDHPHDHHHGHHHH